MNRIYHTWDQWECYRAGFFEVHPPKGMTDEECIEAYKELLLDLGEFRRILLLILEQWPFSCRHNLTNERMNRIAWMGQAALAYKHNIPAKYRGAYNLLTKEQQIAADNCALEVINIWLERNFYDERYNLETIKSKTEVDLY